MVRSTREQRSFFWIRSILGILGCIVVNGAVTSILIKSPWRQPIEAMFILLGLSTLLVIALIPEMNRFRSVIKDPDTSPRDRRLIIFSEAGRNGTIGASERDLEEFIVKEVKGDELSEEEAIALSGLAKRLSSSSRVHSALPAVCYLLENWLKQHPNAENYWTIRIRYDQVKKKALATGQRAWREKWEGAADNI